MPKPNGTFASNRAEIAAKVIDGELIIIRLSDGTYYSMDNVGTRVWELLDAGHTLEAVVGDVAATYGAPADQVEGDVGSLVRELLAEGLITADAAARVPTPDTGLHTAGTLARVAEASDLRAYAAPTLNIYRDMGNLLALDPPTPGIDDLLFRDNER